MRIFTGCLIILCSLFLWLFPVTDAVYDFRTELRTDNFNVTTGVGVTTATVVLVKPVYDDDTDTISISSDNVSEVPTYASYNTTSKALGIANLSANTTRALSVSYDVTALEDNTALEVLLDRVPMIYWILLILFPIAGLVFIFWDKIEQWF